MKNSTFVIGDIHGGLKALVQVLDKANVSINDTIIFLGDYVDGWSESPQVLSYLINLKKTHQCIFIKGNHDDLLLNYLKTNNYKSEWFEHGGKSTIDSYATIDLKTKQEHIGFLEDLRPFYLDFQNRLFIHAGFTNLRGVNYEFFEPMFYWDRTLWELALAYNDTIPPESELYPNRLKIYHEVYIGHTPTTKINQSIPINKATVWNVDTGAGFLGRLTILDINSKKYFQSDPLPNLYPDENGRNSI